jgi:hypothetical protein
MNCRLHKLQTVACSGPAPFSGLPVDHQLRVLRFSILTSTTIVLIVTVPADIALGKGLIDEVLSFTC